MNVGSRCIVGLDAYPLLAGDPSASQYVGGESIQHVLPARAWRDLFDPDRVVRRQRLGVAADFSPVRVAEKYLELSQAVSEPRRRDGTAG